MKAKLALTSQQKRQQNDRLAKKCFQNEGLTFWRSLNSIFDSYKHSGHAIDILNLIPSKFGLIMMQNDEDWVITKFSFFENGLILGYNTPAYTEML